MFTHDDRFHERHESLIVSSPKTNEEKSINVNKKIPTCITNSRDIPSWQNNTNKLPHRTQVKTNLKTIFRSNFGTFVRGLCLPHTEML